MENYDILYKILFSLVLGFLIGLERLKGCKSPPLDVIKDNPCFKDYLDSILNPCQS